MATAEPTARRRAVQAAVLAATEDLLREGASYADLSIEAIARRAGLGRTAFYFYFRDKRELLMRLTEDVNDQLFAQADIWFSGVGEPARSIRAALASIAALYERARRRSCARSSRSRPTTRRSRASGAA